MPLACMAMALAAMATVGEGLMRLTRAASFIELSFRSWKKYFTAENAEHAEGFLAKDKNHKFSSPKRNSSLCVLSVLCGEYS
jgi:hypothetical protein